MGPNAANDESSQMETAKGRNRWLGKADRVPGWLGVFLSAVTPEKFSDHWHGPGDTQRWCYLVLTIGQTETGGFLGHEVRREAEGGKQDEEVISAIRWPHAGLGLLPEQVRDKLKGEDLDARQRKESEYSERWELVKCEERCYDCSGASGVSLCPSHGRTRSGQDGVGGKGQVQSCKLGIDLHLCDKCNLIR